MDACHLKRRPAGLRRSRIGEDEAQRKMLRVAPPWEPERNRPWSASRRSARLIPLTVDGLIYASSMVSGGPSAVARRCAWVLGGALSQHICQVWCLLS